MAVVRVNCHARYSRVADFDTESGHLVERERDDQPVTGGWYARLGRSLVVFYIDGGRIWLRIDDEVWDVEHSAKVSILGVGPLSMFTIAARDGSRRRRLVYRARRVSWLDPTPGMQENEDFDLGLFVVKVSRDPARMDRWRARHENGL